MLLEFRARIASVEFKSDHNGFMEECRDRTTSETR